MEVGPYIKWASDARSEGGKSHEAWAPWKEGVDVPS